MALSLMCVASQPEWVSLSPRGPPCGKLGLGFLTPSWSQDNQTRHFALYTYNFKWQTSGFQLLLKTQTDTVSSATLFWSKQVTDQSRFMRRGSTLHNLVRGTTRRHSEGGSEWGPSLEIISYNLVVFFWFIGLLSLSLLAFCGVRTQVRQETVPSS